MASPSASNTPAASAASHAAPSNGGHKTTAATLAHVALAQDEIRRKPVHKAPTPPPIPPKQPLSPPASHAASAVPSPAAGKQPAMAPSAASTGATIQRIAEFGAPPLKVSTNSAERHKYSRSKSAKATSLRSPSKSPSSSIHSQSYARPRVVPASPVEEKCPPPLPRPNGGAHRSTSHDGGLLGKLKKGKEEFMADGMKAGSFLNKFSHKAWDALGKRGQQKNAPASSVSSQSSSRDSGRDTSNDIDVFGMGLKEAVLRTRIMNTRKRGGEAAYWIPALAYRCLQYLSVHGPGEVGIYRIPGSTSVVDELKTEFKIHHDVDLFDHPPDDIHTVSSLLKGWFRSLPDAVLPRDVQKRIYDKCKDQTDSPRPPKAFVDEISHLPPYNYYLLNHLFSHLSAVCAASDTNKMNLANLGMIFCSTLQIDRFCFNWLVAAWDDCWAGCINEEAEYEASLPRRLPSNASSAITVATAQHQAGSRETSRSRSATEATTSIDRWPSGSSRGGGRSPVPDPRHSPHIDERDRGRAQPKAEPRAAGNINVEVRAGKLGGRTSSVYSSKEVGPPTGVEDRVSMMVESSHSPRGSLNSVDGQLPNLVQTMSPVR